MKHMQDLEAYWNWLPTFRAVAESESLTEAAERLGTGASSLSRTVRLLEESLGRPLFTRSQRTLRPNSDGEILLAAVRDGMRAIHEGIERLRSPEPQGIVRISCTGLYVDRLPDLLAHLCQRFPRLRPELHFAPTAELNGALLRGDLDVAIGVEPSEEEGITVERLERLVHGVYCGPGHPLYDVLRPDPDAILEHAFVGPPRSMPRADHWPAHLRRHVDVRVQQVAQAVELCATGRFLAFLPHSSIGDRALKRIGFDAMTTTEVYALRRADVSDLHPARVVVQSLRERVAERASHEAAIRTDPGK